MIAVALILLASATHVDLVDDVYPIPADRWRYVPVVLRQRTALVTASFETGANSRHVRMALMRREDLDRLRQDKPNGVLATTGPSDSGRLRYAVRVPGEYVLVIDNRSDPDPILAHLRVSLDFGAEAVPDVTQLSPLRQALVIAISFSVFFSIAGYSARRLLRGIKRPTPPELPPP